MRTTLRTDWTVEDVCEGFVFDQNEGKGLFGLGASSSSSPRTSATTSMATGSWTWPWWSPC